MYEPGSNGLLRLATSPGATKAASSLPTSIDLLVCQHGERSISFIRENGTRSYLATHDKKGRRLNSPNDLIWSPDGNLYFTDPPYGLYNSNKDDELVEQERQNSLLEYFKAPIAFMGGFLFLFGMVAGSGWMMLGGVSLILFSFFSFSFHVK